MLRAAGRANAGARIVVTLTRALLAVSCLYKRRGKLAAALQHLEKALMIELTTPG